MKYKVGDIIVSASGSSYVGEIIYISKEEDVVRHRCRKTGTEYEKSYFGFQCRYMSVEERLEKDKEFCAENIQLHQQILTMEREHNDAIAMSKERRESIDALTAQLARREREHEALLETAQKALAHVAAERDEAQAKAAAYERDWYEAKGEFGTAAAKLREKVRALETALTTETRVALDYQKQRDEARAEAEVLRRERDDLYGAVMLAEERGAEWAIRVKAQVVYPLAGDASYVMLAREVCEQARGKR